MSGIEQAQRGGDAGGDVKILYADKAQLVLLCKRLGLMEDLKAGVPRTAYKGVILLRIGGRRVFLAPSYPVDQDITKRIASGEVVRGAPALSDGSLEKSYLVFVMVRPSRRPRARSARPVEVESAPDIIAGRGGRWLLRRRPAIVSENHAL